MKRKITLKDLRAAQKLLDKSKLPYFTDKEIKYFAKLNQRILDPEVIR